MPDCDSRGTLLDVVSRRYLGHRLTREIYYLSVYTVLIQAHTAVGYLPRTYHYESTAKQYIYNAMLNVSCN